MSRQLFQYDPAWGYRFIPDLKTRVTHESGGYLIRTNSSGFRCDHDFEAAKPPGVFRVLLFGDSYTAGDGVSNRSRYGDVLERLEPGLEVYNFGLPGSGTDQQYLIFRELAGGVEHDLVVIAVLVENIRRIAARFRLIRSSDEKLYAQPKPYFVLSPAGGLDLRNVPVPRDGVPEDQLPESERRWVDTGGARKTLRAMITKLGPVAKSLAQRFSRYQPVPAYNKPDNPDWLLMKAILRRWIAESQAPVVIMPIPLYQFVEGHSDPRAYQARFRELASEAGVRVHDPLPDLQRVPANERRALRFPQDVHPTPAAHEILARSVLPVIQSFRAISTSV